MYISETAQAEQRGRLVLLEGWFGIGGIVLAAWLDFGMYYAKSSVNWRFPIAFQLVFVLFVVSMILLLPESPRWLVKQDRFEEATEVIAKLDDLSEGSDVVGQDLAIIRQSLLEDETPGHGISSSPFALTKNRHLHRTMLAVLLTMFAQMTGTNIITFYSDTILESTLGYSGTIARVISGCIQIWSFVGAGIGVLLIDRVGRRKLLLGSMIGLAVSQACLAGLSSDVTNKGAASASILFYFVALFSFPIGLFLVPFMYAAEIAPLRIRAKVTAMAAATSWLFNFLLAEVTPVGFANIGWRYYIIYAATSTLGCVVIYTFYPETKGRSLEEIDDIFIHSKSIFDFVRVARELPLQSQITAIGKHEDELEKGEEKIENVG
jgi:sugar porter (SP) family MFS transporter